MEESKDYANPLDDSSKILKRVFIVLVALAVGYYLWGWHKDAVIENWFLIFFLLCPLMHLLGGCGGSKCDDKAAEK